MITLDYFIDSFIVALATVILLESRPYEIFIDWVYKDSAWEIKKYAYCSLCAGFWIGGWYFGAAQYFGLYKVSFLTGAVLVSGGAYTIKGLWLRLYGTEAHDD